jgi:hypothetical protein
MSTYHRTISLRLATILSALLMAAAAVFAFTNRSRLESRIQHIRASEPSCALTRPAPAGDCGVAHLLQLRQGDVLGLPFLALGLGFFLVLVYKIGHPGGDPPGAIGDSGGEDPIV